MRPDLVPCISERTGEQNDNHRYEPIEESEGAAVPTMR